MLQHVTVVLCIAQALAQPEGACDAPLAVYGASLLLFVMWVVDFVALYVRSYPPTGKGKTI